MKLADLLSLPPEEAKRLQEFQMRPSTRWAIRGDEVHFFDYAEKPPSDLCLCCGINPGDQFKKGRK